MKLTRPRGAAFLICLILAAAMGDITAQESLPPESLREIRKKDLIVRKQGSPLEVIVLSEGDLSILTEIEVTRGAATFVLKADEIESIVRRQSVSDVYENWSDWIYRSRREKKARARSEYMLARWCHYPNVDNDGNPPNEAASLEHFEKAVRLDPTLHEVYPFLISIYSVLRDVDSAPLELMDREIETYLLAQASGYDSVDMRFRMAIILASRLGQPQAAVSHLQFVLEHDDAKPGQKRISRAVLAELYFGQGQSGEAIALYQPMIGASGSADNAENFEALYRVARMKMRLGGNMNLTEARNLLNRAKVVQPGYAEIELDLAALDYAEGKLSDAAKKLRIYLKDNAAASGARVDLALVQMRIGLLETAAKTLAEVSIADGREANRAHIARGLLAEIKGDYAVALDSYRQATRAEPASAMAPILVAATLLRTQQAASAKQVIDELLKAFGHDREIFGACSRLLAELNLQMGKRNEAASLLEYATDVSPEDPQLLERTGLAFFGSSQGGRGATYLAEAGKRAPNRAPSLAGLGYYRYSEGDIPGAKLHFEKVLEQIKALPKDPILTWKDGLKTYALAAQAQIEDLQTLEVWSDNFEGVASATVDGWQKSELFGVRVARKEQSVIFEGTQKNSPDGLTEIRLMRPIESRSFDRMRINVQVTSGRAMPAMHLESGDDRNASSGLMVLRDADGKVKVKVQDARTGWKEVELNPEVVAPVQGRRGTSQSSRKTIYGGGVPWPAAAGYHTFEIRRAMRAISRTSRSARFEVYFDGQTVAKNMTIPGFGRGDFRAVLSGRSDALDNSFSFSVKKFRVYRKARSSR